jgi:hypothetical protein
VQNWFTFGASVNNAERTNTRQSYATSIPAMDANALFRAGVLVQVYDVPDKRNVLGRSAIM